MSFPQLFVHIWCFLNIYVPQRLCLSTFIWNNYRTDAGLLYEWFEWFWGRPNPWILVHSFWRRVGLLILCGGFYSRFLILFFGSMEYKKMSWWRSSPTFGFVGVCRGDVLGEHLEALLALVVQPQVHLPPRLVLLRRLSLEVSLTVAHPQLVGVFCEPLKREGRGSLVSTGNCPFNGNIY